eukprot:gene3652-6468_t
METYKYSFSCGPTLIDEKAMSVYQEQFHPSYQNHKHFIKTYKETQDQVKRLVNVDDDYEVYFQTGESILGIWSCLKSTLKPKEKVTIIENGYYAQKIQSFIEGLGYELSVIHFPENETSASNIDLIKQKILSFQPKLVICVHCETNSGILNSILDIGEICIKSKSYLMVDFVSSAGAMEILMKEWNVDFGVLGTHKSLNLPPDLSILVTSPGVKEIIDENKYRGYDGLYQYKDIFQTKIFPYCPNYRSILALNKKLESMEDEGIQTIFKNHEKVSRILKDGIEELGLELYPKYSQFLSPFVTCVKIPKHIHWKDLNQRFLKEDFLVSVGLGNLKKHIFRIGHMGLQADEKKAKHCIQIIKEVLEDFKQTPLGK